MILLFQFSHSDLVGPLAQLSEFLNSFKDEISSLVLVKRPITHPVLNCVWDNDEIQKKNCTVFLVLRNLVRARATPQAFDPCAASTRAV